MLWVGVAVAQLGTGLSPASAASVASKRQEAVRLQAQIDRIDDRLSGLDEDANQAKVRLAQTKIRQSDAEADVDRAAADLAARQLSLRQRALRAYASNGSTSATFDMDTSLANNVRRRTYLDLVQGRELDQVDALNAAQQDLQAKRRKADVARAEARRDAAAIAGAQKRAEVLLVQQQKFLTRASGELSVLVREEQVRQARAEAARVRRELAQRQTAARAELARRQAEAAKAKANRGSGSGGLSSRLRSATNSSGASQDAALAADAGTGPDLAPSTGGTAAVAAARGQIGKPYLWGAGGTSAFDCSGLTSYAWRLAGRSLPHSSRAQYAGTTRVSVGALQPGDLLFYGSPIHHVGLYIGNGEMLEAPHRGALVRVKSIYRRDLVGAGRVG